MIITFPQDTGCFKCQVDYKTVYSYQYAFTYSLCRLMPCLNPCNCFLQLLLKFELFIDTKQMHSSHVIGKTHTHLEFTEFCQYEEERELCSTRTE